MMSRISSFAHYFVKACAPRLAYVYVRRAYGARFASYSIEGRNAPVGSERGAVALLTTVIVGILLSIITTGLVALMVS